MRQRLGVREQFGVWLGFREQFGVWFGFRERLRIQLRQQFGIGQRVSGLR